jgi:ferrous iron transport protein B
MATTRGYFSKQSQRRTVAVLAFIPCGAKLPVFLTLLSPLFANPFPAVCVLYFAGILLSLLVAKLMRGEGEELFSEVTPIAFPSLKPCLFKLLFYVKGFIIKVTTTVMLFCVFSWVLSHFDGAFTPCDVADSMLAQIAKAFLPLFRPMGVESWQMCYALLTGAVAKENIAASIAMLLPEGTGLTLASALSVSVFVLLCPACISAFAASKKEVGARFTLVYFALQLLAAFAISYVVYFIFGWFI